MSLWDALSAAATPLAVAAGANQEGIAAGNQQNTGNLLDTLKLYQQKAATQLATQKAQSEMALQGAQKSEADARTSALNNPPIKQREAYTVPGVGLGHYGPDGKFVVDQPEVPKSDAVKLSPGESLYNPDGSVKIKGPAALPSYTPLVTTAPGGQQVVTPFDTKTGTASAPIASAKTAAGVGGGALANRQKDYVALMNDAMPDLENLTPKVRPAAVSANIKFPMASNPALTPDERQYMSSARDFLAGVLHEESGARLSDAQIAFGVQRYFPTVGDDPATVQKKLANARATLAARRANANYVPPGAPVNPANVAPDETTAGGGGRSNSAGGKTMSHAEYLQLSPAAQSQVTKLGYTITP